MGILTRTGMSKRIPTIRYTVGLAFWQPLALVFQAIQRGARLLGEPLAGALIAVIGPSRVLFA